MKATTRKPHPSDIWSENVIAEAVEWTAFCQGGGRITLRFDNRADAEAMAQRLANEHFRAALVYAVSAQGRTALATTVQPQKETVEMSTEANMTGLQIAELTAIITGGGTKRANSREAAIARFVRAATEAGIENPDALVNGSFENAKQAIVAKIGGKALPAAEEKSPRKTTAKAEDGAKSERAAGKRAAALEAAQRGEIPPAPDFSAATHKPHRKRLAAVVAMVEARDVAGLKALEIKPTSSSPRAILRYRDLAVIALEAPR
ncbi:hypothetical protein [Chelatococcus asaccharovorans]|uniref:hypothetical protein n=1 Tax=Chelatococcus asaccharovorans TaxID=28210 RepID=UPI00224C7ADA|nr:hypothetical protein [Chelatococcus asaccharovorans]CAH1649792.1 conserved hypothetical protein [Chelatococcus asaccharovorans]CAH1686896.1 conserved hypothetical protein [Chelatococcus asaccharovorans]